MFRYVTASFCVLFLTGTLMAAEERKPNVIVILADDLGSADVGCYGADDLETPNIDALAERGVRFTEFYAAASVCSPSRAALLTGRFPLVCGLNGNAPSIPGSHAGLPTEEVTMGEMFKKAGYATAHIGKWHLGLIPEKLPNGQGFDYSFGHHGGCIDNYSHFFYWRGPNRHDLHRNDEEVFHDGEYFPDLMVREASEFITKHRDEPFFIYFAMNMPHYPYQGDAKWLEHFKDLPYPRNLYAAFVASQDQRIGNLLQHLEELSLTEDTIVIFQSDNGHSTEERAHFGGGSAGEFFFDGSTTFPTQPDIKGKFRGAKFSLFEGGIRSPAIISWPGHISPGNIGCTGHACDWMPTLADYCDIDTPDAELDGISLREWIDDPFASAPPRILHWTTGGWAVRDGAWKLIGETTDTTNGRKKLKVKMFLTYLIGDLSETENLADKHPEVVERLKKLHDDFVKRAKKE
ncbi:sulfatase-like hydrolase/transferase [Calycomorphotria hydatis]|uniref:Arylsulfatase n=1 Tax=Calycomorphotria hydatis TaxID=2528027 RepID=A0A517T749_9PLAN|nr:sulfatase-like hydrolase/transferase [Calycomorphotria hydatis]QDT64201.1 Arylsulfatase precursor [Calycomorphotria hydatis]